MARGQRYSEEIKERAFALAAITPSVSAIAKELNLPRTTVKGWLEQRSEDRGFWEKKYRGYEFLGFEKPPADCYNEYNGYYYLTVKLYLRDKPPKPKKKINARTDKERRT